jgi:hypothetical protein
MADIEGFQRIPKKPQIGLATASAIPIFAAPHRALRHSNRRKTGRFIRIKIYRVQHRTNGSCEETRRQSLAH